MSEIVCSNKQVGKCPYHFWPNCHPAQVDENNDVYACRHPAWPQNNQDEFEPIVKCGGDVSKCEITSDHLKQSITILKRDKTRCGRELQEYAKRLSECRDLAQKKGWDL